MASSTARGAFPYPASTDPDDVPGYMQQLADRMAAVGALYSHESPRPAAGIPGRLHRHPVTEAISYDTGTAWEILVKETTANAAYAPKVTKGARVFLSAATTLIPNATWTAVGFVNESRDTDAFHDNATNTSRLTVPAGLGGQYSIEAMVEFAVNATGFRIARITVNGVLANRLGEHSSAAVSGNETTLNPVVGAVTLAAGDYVEVMVYQTSGGALAITGQASGYATHLALHRLGDS